MTIISNTQYSVGDVMRCFNSIAKLIRTKRLQHPKSYSQSELSHLLGYKNGQFISNVERALCNIPLKMLIKVCDVLEITTDELKTAILKDHDDTLNNYLQIGHTAEIKELHSVSGKDKLNTTKFSEEPINFKMSSNS